MTAEDLLARAGELPDGRGVGEKRFAPACNDELRRAARDGLGSMPEAVGTSAARLLALGAELLG